MFTNAAMNAFSHASRSSAVSAESSRDFTGVPRMNEVSSRHELFSCSRLTPNLASVSHVRFFSCCAACFLSTMRYIVDIISNDEGRRVQQDDDYYCLLWAWTHIHTYENGS